MELVIRPARMDDINEIWNLLHANSLAWTDTRIVAELSWLWVMLQDSKMLGVLCGNFETAVKKVHWVAIHPIYAEKQLREAMINGICGILRISESAENGMLIKSKFILNMSQ